MSKQKRVTRSYTPEYKVEAVKLAKEIGLKPAAEELGIPHAIAAIGTDASRTNQGIRGRNQAIKRT